MSEFHFAADEGNIKKFFVFREGLWDLILRYIAAGERQKIIERRHMFEISTIEEYQWIFGFLASVIGGISALIFQPIILKFNRRVDLSARVWEKIQDKRFRSYETVLSVAKELRQTMATGRHEDGHIETFPSILKTKESFFAWHNTFSEKQIIWEDWVDQPTSEELRYIIDYMYNLRITINASTEEQLSELRLTVKEDILNISLNLSKVAHRFFSKIDRKRLGYGENGKLSLRVTNKRLSKTNLNLWMNDHNLMPKEGGLVP